MEKKLRSTKGLTEKQLLRLRRDELVTGILNARVTTQVERDEFTRVVELLRKHASPRLKKIINLQ